MPKYLDSNGLTHLWSKISMEDYPNNETLIAVLNAIDETKADKDYVEILYKKLNSNATLGFYCVEDVTVVINDTSTVYPANSNVEIKMADDDVFEIIPTSDYSILSLSAFPGALGTYYSWLEGVKQFSNILFDMNAEDMYTKWNQGNQGAYQVQYAQYSNCIFWSDNPYINDVTKRTNYTLYNSAQLPLCYSNIPDNTFKAFYLALGVVNDPNWSNSAYKESFAKATWATQVFSYYGARIVGTPEHFTIALPKDCRGLMFYARNVEAAGTFDAANVTNFGAKSGSWRDAFGYCDSLRKLYIENLKVNLNVSWSPINQESISYIISNAANTSAITISVSPYTYYSLKDSDFELAASKNITIELITTNYVEDRRLSNIANKADITYVDTQINNLSTVAATGSWNDLEDKPFGDMSVNIDEDIELNYLTETGGGALIFSSYISKVNPFPDLILKENMTYNITITEKEFGNQRTFTEIPYLYNDNLVLGDSSLVNGVSAAVVDGPSSFFYGYINDGFYLIINGLMEEQDTNIFNIKITNSDIKQLDEVFIPSTIARTTDIPDIPEVTISDNGKVLGVVDGAVGLVELDIPSTDGLATAEDVDVVAKVHIHSANLFSIKIDNMFIETTDNDILTLFNK